MEKFGLIGERLIHSFSPQIHNEIFSHINLKAEYNLYEISQKEKYKIVDFLKKENIKGCNITIPYKETVLNQVDFISDEAKELGSINTILIKKNKSYGYNTDYYGFGKMLKINNVEVENKTFTIMGSGGAARSVIKYLEDNNAKKIYVVSRNKEDSIHKFKNSDIEIINYKQLELLKTGFALINTTPCGMYPDIDKSPVNNDIISNYEVLIDLIYNPIQTQFLKKGFEQGLKTINGLFMLVGQAIKSEEIWNELNINKSKEKQIYKKLKVEKLKNKKNKGILLIGMPGCGKTTIGKSIAQSLDLDFVDMDEYIEFSTNKTIKNLFIEGECIFRDVESKICKKISAMENIIISSGGGVVLRNENMKNLNGFLIVFINRSVENILEDIDMSTRPLLEKNKTNLKKLYKERINLYKKYADIEIENNEKLEKVLEKINKLIK